MSLAIPIVTDCSTLFPHKLRTDTFVHCLIDFITSIRTQSPTLIFMHALINYINSQTKFIIHGKAIFFTLETEFESYVVIGESILQN